MLLSRINKPKNSIILGLILIIALFGFIIYVRYESSQNLQKLDNKVNEKVTQIEKTYNNLNENLDDQLFIDHLELAEKIKLEGELATLNLELEELKNTEKGSTYTKVNQIYTDYQAFQTKLKRNTDVKLKTDSANEATKTWGQLLIDKKFDELSASISDESKKLEDDYKKYLATLPPPATAGGNGYSFVTVDTERGKFGVYLIKASKSSVRVKTLAAIEDDCENDCATKSLQEYINENNAYAGIAGSYECPADYAACADKKWSFDFALYDSNDGKWLNKDALSWGDTGLITFNGSSVKGYESTSDFGGGSVSAAISNYPFLVSGGNVVVDSGDIDSSQSTKGTRGVLGIDDNNIYLAYVTKASVVDAAYAIKALGAKSALNLDGGGTAAMYVNGKYVVGPGRPLANAIILVK